jgi:hypothetical protein
MGLRRRELLAAGGAAAASGLLGAAGAASAQGGGDTGLLSGLIAIEQESSLVYGTLAPAAGVPARDFRAHSREHARGLSIALRNRGGHPPAPRARVGRATTAQALALEERALAAYERAVGEFGDQALLPTLAAVMANHGQHAVVLRRALGRAPLPPAFPGRGAR